MVGVSYISLSIVMFAIVMIILIVGKKRYGQPVKIWLVPTALVIWLGYLGVLTKFNILFDDTLPKFPLLLIAPFFLFCIVFFIRNKNNAFIQSLPLTWTSFFQSFRIPVEFILLYTFLEGVIPVEPTFEGYNFDVGVGITAIFIGLLIWKTKMKYKKLLVFWNILGIVMVLFVGFIVASSFYIPELWGHEVTLLKNDFFNLPYLLIPGFLAPLAIFVHIISLIQLRGK